MKDFRIIVAGASGYIGKQFSNFLEKHFIDHICIDLIPSKQTKNNTLDLRKFSELKLLVDDYKPHFFYHFATHSALAYKKSFLESYEHDNLVLINLIRSLEKKSDCKIIYCSSSYVYSGINLENIVDEKSVLNPIHNFGLSKAFAEQFLLRNYKNSVIFRLSSVFGEGTYLHPNVIEMISKEALTDGGITVWGSGNRKMQFVYLYDILKIMFKVKLIPTGIYNLSGNSYLSVLETSEIISNFLNVPIKFIKSKKEGETLPEMSNNKINSIFNGNQFSDFNKSVTNYLKNLQV